MAQLMEVETHVLDAVGYLYLVRLIRVTKESANACESSRASFGLTCQLSWHRRKINELAEEVERLRSAVDRRAADASPSSASNGPGASSKGYGQQSSENQSPPNRLSQGVATYIAGSCSASHPRSLDHIALDKHRISDLFRM